MSYTFSAAIPLCFDRNKLSLKNLKINGQKKENTLNLKIDGQKKENT